MPLKSRWGRVSTHRHKRSWRSKRGMLSIGCTCARKIFESSGFLPRDWFDDFHTVKLRTRGHIWMTSSFVHSFIHSGRKKRRYQISNGVNKFWSPPPFCLLSDRRDRREIFKFYLSNFAQTGLPGRSIPGVLEATECRKHDSIYRHVSGRV